MQIVLNVQIKELITKLEESLQKRDAERRKYKDQHGIMTQEEREAAMKKQAAAQQSA